MIIIILFIHRKSRTRQLKENGQDFVLENCNEKTPSQQQQHSSSSKDNTAGGGGGGDKTIMVQQIKSHRKNIPKLLQRLIMK